MQQPTSGDELTRNDSFEMSHAPIYCLPRAMSLLESQRMPPTSVDPDGSTVAWERFSVEIRDYTWWWAPFTMPYLWRKVDSMLRTVFIAILPGAVLIVSTSTRNTFVSIQMVMVAAFITATPLLGQGVMRLSLFLKGTLFWLPFCTEMNALQLWLYPVAWYFVYTFVVFFVSIFMTGFTKRLTIVMFNIVFIAQNAAIGRDLKYPSQMFVDWLVGICFGLVSNILPIPRLAGSRIDATLARASKVMYQFVPLAKVSFWSTSAVDRQEHLGHLRHLYEQLTTELSTLLAQDQADNSAPGSVHSDRGVRWNPFRGCAGHAVRCLQRSA